MADRRMFSIKIIDTDNFLDMSTSARLLYYDLGVRADDDGFVDAPKKIMRSTGSSEDDLKLLIMKGFIIPFESGVCVIRDWRIHNSIRKDRYQETRYLKEKSQLIVNEDGSYALRETVGIPDDNQVVDKLAPQDRLGKDRIGKIEDTSVSSCAEQSEIPPVPEPEPVISLPLNDNSFHPVYQEDVNQWSELYPVVDVMQELRGMKGWLCANPTKRKTRKGIPRFINSWLSREQDKGGNRNDDARPAQPSTPRDTGQNQKLGTYL